MLVETIKRFKLRSGKWITTCKKIDITRPYAAELLEDEKVKPVNEADLSDLLPEFNKGPKDTDDEEE